MALTLSSPPVRTPSLVTGEISAAKDRKAVIEWGMQFLAKMTVSPVDADAIANTVGVHELNELLKGELIKVEREIQYFSATPSAWQAIEQRNSKIRKVDEVIEDLKNNKQWHNSDAA